MDTTIDKFIGKGLIFPIKLNSGGKPDISGDSQLLEASLRNILSWTTGTRFFLGEYGTRLEQLLQEPNDLVTEVLVKHFTVEVVEQWDKRLEILEVKLERRSEISLHIRINFRVKNTKIENSFIFPYYSQLIN